MAITPIYGSRPNAAGWQRATTFHPWEDMGIDPGDAMEKNARSISGGSDRAKSSGGRQGQGQGQPSQQAYRTVGGGGGGVGGQARSPYQRKISEQRARLRPGSFVYGEGKPSP